MNSIPDNLRFGGGYTSSSMHPAVFVLMVIAIILIFTLPRKYIAVPLLLMLFLTPRGNQLYIAGLHFFVNRILIVCGWIRVARLSRSEAGFSMGLLDKVFLYWALCRAVGTYLEFFETQAAINQVGFLWDNLGTYFLLRRVIHTEEDVSIIVKTFVAIVSVLSVTMINERVNAVNVFGYLGGRLAPILRDGSIRSFGTFAGPIPAGTFGATLLCLFIWLMWRRRSYLTGLLGIAGSMTMVITSASSTPLLTFPAGLIAIAMWPLRKNMRLIRWALLGCLVSLHMVMKAPVWMLIARIDLVGGNSSYHRAAIIDQFVKHFSDWWLVGVQSTEGWGWDMWDQANQFCAEGEAGGLATFVLFVALVSWGFGRLGKARRVARDRNKEWVCWLLGATMFAYVVSFFGISFNDQSVYAWHAFLAMICATTGSILSRAPEVSVRTPAARDDWAVAGESSVASTEVVANGC